MNKLILALPLILASMNLYAATAAKDVEPKTSSQNLQFQLTQPIEFQDVTDTSAGGELVAAVDVPGKGQCTLTGKTKIVSSEPEGAGARLDFAGAASIECAGTTTQVSATLLDSSGKAGWLPPQVNLCLRWDSADISKHPTCLKRSMDAYWLDKGTVKVSGLSGA